MRGVFAHSQETYPDKLSGKYQVITNACFLVTISLTKIAGCINEIYTLGPRLSEKFIKDEFAKTA